MPNEDWLSIALVVLTGYLVFRWNRGRSVVFYVNGILVVISLKRNRFNAFFFGEEKEIRHQVTEVLGFPYAYTREKRRSYMKKILILTICLSLCGCVIDTPEIRADRERASILRMKAKRIKRAEKYYGACPKKK